MPAVFRAAFGIEGCAMPFVSRNEQGAITGVFGRQTAIAHEELDVDHPELRAFLQGPGARHVRGRLLASDTEMARIAEDIIEVLIAKNIINFTDFPREAQQKLLRRRDLRRNLSTLSNLVGDEDDIIV
ncbi:hypothetical protein JYU08_00375 [bacterium AH-315-B06]|nr:hypothetical protein [bacterium AH-315-B06]